LGVAGSGASIGSFVVGSIASMRGKYASRRRWQAPPIQTCHKSRATSKSLRRLDQNGDETHYIFVETI